MFTIQKDSDPRRTDLHVKHNDSRFYLADNGTILNLSLSEARKLVEVLMEETMRVNLIAEQQEGEDA